MRRIDIQRNVEIDGTEYKAGQVAFLTDAQYDAFVSTKKPVVETKKAEPKGKKSKKAEPKTEIGSADEDGEE